jgi:hypothetical protein
MFLRELTETPPVLEAQMVWARKGNKLVRKYRCTVGARQGRVVADPAQCHKSFDLKKRFNLKKTKAKLGSKMAKKASKTKKFNPASKALKRLNRTGK